MNKDVLVVDGKEGIKQVGRSGVFSREDQARLDLLLRNGGVEGMPILAEVNPIVGMVQARDVDCRHLLDGCR